MAIRTQSLVLYVCGIACVALLFVSASVHATGMDSDKQCTPFYSECQCMMKPNPDKRPGQPKCIQGENKNKCICTDKTNTGTTIGTCVSDGVCKGTTAGNLDGKQTNLVDPKNTPWGAYSGAGIGNDFGNFGSFGNGGEFTSGGFDGADTGGNPALDTDPGESWEPPQQTDPSPQHINTDPNSASRGLDLLSSEPVSSQKPDLTGGNATANDTFSQTPVSQQTGQLSSGSTGDTQGNIGSGETVNTSENTFGNAERNAEAQSSCSGWWCSFTQGVGDRTEPATSQSEPEVIKDVNAKTTFYGPGAGGTMQGGFETSKPGLDGQYVPRTLDDVRLGKSDAVTLASNQANYGKFYDMGQVTYKSPIDGVTYTGSQEIAAKTGAVYSENLDGVTGYVHDTGSAFNSSGCANYGTCGIMYNKFDVAVGDFRGWSDGAAMRFLTSDGQSYGGNITNEWQQIAGLPSEVQTASLSNPWSGATAMSYAPVAEVNNFGNYNTGFGDNTPGYASVVDSTPHAFEDANTWPSSSQPIANEMASLPPVSSQSTFNFIGSEPTGGLSGGYTGPGFANELAFAGQTPGSPVFQTYSAFDTGTQGFQYQTDVAQSAYDNVAYNVPTTPVESAPLEPYQGQISQIEPVDGPPAISAQAGVDSGLAGASASSGASPNGITAQGSVDTYSGIAQSAQSQANPITAEANTGSASGIGASVSANATPGEMTAQGSTNADTAVPATAQADAPVDIPAEPKQSAPSQSFLGRAQTTLGNWLADAREWWTGGDVAGSAPVTPVESGALADIPPATQDGQGGIGSDIARAPNQEIDDVVSGGARTAGVERGADLSAPAPGLEIPTETALTPKSAPGMEIQTETYNSNLGVLNLGTETYNSNLDIFNLGTETYNSNLGVLSLGVETHASIESGLAQSLGIIDPVAELPTGEQMTAQIAAEAERQNVIPSGVAISDLPPGRYSLGGGDSLIRDTNGDITYTDRNGAETHIAGNTVGSMTASEFERQVIQGQVPTMSAADVEARIPSPDAAQPDSMFAPGAGEKLTEQIAYQDAMERFKDDTPPPPQRSFGERFMDALPGTIENIKGWAGAAADWFKNSLEGRGLAEVTTESPEVAARGALTSGGSEPTLWQPTEASAQPPADPSTPPATTPPAAPPATQPPATTPSATPPATTPPAASPPAAPPPATPPPATPPPATPPPATPPPNTPPPPPGNQPGSGSGLSGMLGSLSQMLGQMLGKLLGNNQQQGTQTPQQPAAPTTTTPTIPQVQAVASLLADPARTTTGNSVRLVWASVGTIGCSIKDGAGTQVSSGSADGFVRTEALATSTTFTLACATSVGGSVSASTTVIVSPAATTTTATSTATTTTQ